MHHPVHERRSWRLSKCGNWIPWRSAAPGHPFDGCFASTNMWTVQWGRTWSFSTGMGGTASTAAIVPRYRRSARLVMVHEHVDRL